MMRHHVRLDQNFFTHMFVVFAALVPKNGTSATLSLSKPQKRQHWGYGTVRAGLREWAEENGLEVVGANFIYAQDEKQ